MRSAIQIWKSIGSFRGGTGYVLPINPTVREREQTEERHSLSGVGDVDED